MATFWLTIAVHGQPVTFKNPTPAANDQFGRAVAGLGADRLLVCAHLDDTAAGDAGSAYLFNTNGTLLATFANPRASATDYFGYALASVGGNGVLVGAYLEDSGVLDSGRAYLFNTNGLLITTFTNPSPAQLDFFAWSVAAVGEDRVLISAHLDDAWATDSGSAYLFNTNGQLLNTFVNPTPARGDSFGWSVVSVGAELVAIGAQMDDTISRDAGAVYLFKTDGALIATLHSPRPRQGDQFGWSMAAVGGERLLVSAPGDDTGAFDAGAVFLFDLAGKVLATINNPTPAYGDWFGGAVAGLGTDRILVGAHLDDAGAQDAGVVYPLDTEGKLLETIMNPEPTNQDFFGVSLAAVGPGHAIIGAHYADAGGQNAGAAFLVKLRSE